MSLFCTAGFKKIDFAQRDGNGTHQNAFRSNGRFSILQCRWRYRNFMSSSIRSKLYFLRDPLFFIQVAPSIT